MQKQIFHTHLNKKFTPNCFVQKFLIKSKKHCFLTKNSKYKVGGRTRKQLYEAKWKKKRKKTSSEGFYAEKNKEKRKI